jgi:hypothetical protein
VWSGLIAEFQFKFMLCLLWDAFIFIDLFCLL